MATASTDITKYDLSDTTSAVSPAYLAALYNAIKKHNDSLVIGVCHTGTYSNGFMNVKYIGLDYNDRNDITADFFNSHPSWAFRQVILDGSYFTRIPIAYMKRGTVPSGKPNAGKWYMMLSPTPRDGFEPHLAAFMYKGILRDSFLWSSYRASVDSSGKIVSMPGQADSYKFNDTNDKILSLGDGYHMGSFQEWHEILTRAVIEKKTFDLWPSSEATDLAKNIYRGINKMAYSFSGEGVFETRAGIIPQLENNTNFHVWDNQGNHTWVDAGFRDKGYLDMEGFRGLRTGAYFDHLFFDDFSTSGDIIINAMQPASGRNDVVVSFGSYGAPFNGVFTATLDIAINSYFRLAYIS